MKPFAYADAGSVEEAIRWLGRYGEEAKVLAGGVDLIFLMKKRIGPTRYLVNIRHIPGLDQIGNSSPAGNRSAQQQASVRVDPHGHPGSVTIGALATLTDIVTSPLIRQHLPILACAAASVATPQIRNVATLAGNLLQEVWCWYLRDGYCCWKNLGRTCPAAVGDNRNYFSVTGGNHCIAAHPSDTATALAALEATVQVAGPDGKRMLSINELLPGTVMIDGRVQAHTLRHDELLTAIHIPPPLPNSHSIFLKLRLRQSWDFALTSVAALLSWQGEIVQRTRIVLGGVSTGPYRSQGVEANLTGQPLTPNSIAHAVEEVFDRLQPLRMNGYKIDMARGLLKQALEALARERQGDPP